MSTGIGVSLPLPLIAGRVRAYYAPVGTASFDAAAQAGWVLDAPPAPWVDLGWTAGFTRSSESKLLEVESGSPATVQVQARQKVGATVQCRFERWNRLTMALATGSDSVNLMAPGASAIGLQPGSTAGLLYPVGTAQVSVGGFVVVDDDYAGQTGFVGAGGAGMFVRNASVFAGNADYIRRCSLNVGQIGAVNGDGGLQLARPLPGGPPTATMKLQQIIGFADREGGLFSPEWSALFAMQGTQGETLFFFYPRLQAMGGAREVSQILHAPLNRLWLEGQFRALPVADKVDGNATVCYRSFLPGAACRI